MGMEGSINDIGDGQHSEDLPFEQPLTYVVLMTLLDRAIVAIRKLPVTEQEALASELLQRLSADEKWDRLIADPRSEALLSRLAVEARDEVARGEFQNGDPSGAES